MILIMLSHVKINTIVDFGRRFKDLLKENPNA